MRLHTGFDLIALDAASIFALRREWGRLYDDPDTILPAIGLGFRDYVLEEEAYRGTEAWKASEAYWRMRGATLPGGPDRPRARGPGAGRTPLEGSGARGVGKEGGGAGGCRGEPEHVRKNRITR